MRFICASRVSSGVAIQFALLFVLLESLSGMPTGFNGVYWRFDKG